MIIQVSKLPVTAPDNSIRIMIIASAIGTATHAHLRQTIERLALLIAFKLSFNVIVFKETNYQ